MTSLQITKLVFSPSIFYPWQCYTNLMTFCFSLNLLRNLPLHFISWIMYHSVPTLHVLHHLLNLSINLPEPTPSTTHFYRLPVSGICSPQLIFLLFSFYSVLKRPSSNSSGITLSIISIQVIIGHFIIYVRVISV